MGRRATLAQVAARAGVSASTASLAFSGAGPVAAATRERVLAAARELDYAGPDPRAVSLRRGRSGVVGVVVGERLTDAFADPFAVAVLDALAGVLARHALAPLLLPLTPDGAGGPAQQFTTVPLDAVVFPTGAQADEPALPLLLQRGVPVVAVEGPVHPDVPLLSLADRAGAAAAARHLLALGHRRVAVVTMPWRLDGRRGPLTASRRAVPGFPDASRRLAGAEDVLVPVAVHECAANALEEGEAAAAALLAAAPPAGDRSGSAGPPTAVLAQSDVLAAGVVRGAERLGVAVPERLSVVGFDGVELPWFAPHRLTTMVQPVREKGEAAAEAVLALLAGRRPPDRELPVALRTGTTTGPPPG